MWGSSVNGPVLVTGAAGFIGSHVAQALVAKGRDVRILDNLSTGFVENFAAFREQVEFIHADLGDAKEVDRAAEGVDTIFHLAALASVPLSIENPVEVNRSCVDGTLNVLSAAVKQGVRRVVYSASSACYGDKPFLANRESDLPEPLSPYAVAKLAGEYYCQAFYQTHGLETVGLRYFNVFGPRQDPNSHYSAVIPIFISRLLAGEPPTVFGDGGQSRDFTFVANVVHANLLAAEAAADKAAGQVFNIADGRSITLLELLAALGELLGCSVEPIHAPARQGEVRDSMADISKATRDLGYRPQVGFHDGLKRSIEYYKSILSKA